MKINIFYALALSLAALSGGCEVSAGYRNPPVVHYAMPQSPATSAAEQQINKAGEEVYAAPSIFNPATDCSPSYNAQLATSQNPYGLNWQKNRSWNQSCSKNRQYYYSY